MREKTNNIKLLQLLSLCTVVAINACGGSGSGGSSEIGSDIAPSVLENPVRLDSLGVFPASNNGISSYVMQVTNYSGNKYILESVRVLDIESGKDSALVAINSQLCSILPASGSCSLQLTPHSTKSTDVKLVVKLKDTSGKVISLYQLIRISGKLKATNGGIVMLNDVSRVVSEDGNYSLSIPVVLGETYDEIKASNGSLLCNTSGGYLKGSSCTYQIHGRTGKNGAVVSTKLEGIKNGKVATVSEANTRVEVGKGAHLLLSHGVSIDDPESSGIVRVFNSGNSEASNIEASEKDESLSITDTCGETLGAGDSCDVGLQVEGNLNGQGVLSLTYADGSTNYTVSTNVSYTVANATAGIEFTEISNNLTNAIIGGKTRIAEVEIKNTSNRPLAEISYYLAPANGNFKIKASDTKACTLGGTHTLAANESCRVKIEYTPTSVTAEKTINLVVNGEYTDQYGQIHSLLKEHGLNYSAIAVSSSSLSWNRTSGPANLYVSTNNTESQSATWDLSNTLAADEGLSATLSENVKLSIDSIDGLRVEPQTAEGSCASGGNIAGGEKCSYVVTYGPTEVETALTEIYLQANYTLGSKTLSSDSSTFKVRSGLMPVIQSDVEMSIEPASLFGDGIIDPWGFTALSNNMMELTYKFSNTGGLVANDFNVDIGNLPAGTAYDGGDCAVGINTAALESGTSCTIKVIVPDAKIFATPNLTSKLNSGKLDINLPYSYVDGMIINETEPGNRRYVEFSRLWGSVSHEVEGYADSAERYEHQVKTSVGIDDNTPGVTYPITVTPTLANPISGVVLEACEITTGEDSCINNIYLPKDKFIEGSKLRVNFEIQGSGMKESDLMISSYTLTNLASASSRVSGVVTVLDAKTTTADTLTGSGTKKDPYKFMMVKDRYLDLQYTFTNNGDEIRKFNINTSSLPFGVKVVTTGANYCTGTGDKTQSLGIGKSCTVTVRIPKEEAFTAGLLAEGSGSLEIGLPFSWIDETGAHSKDASSNTKYVILNSTWAKDLTLNTNGSYLANGQYQINIVSQVNDFDADAKLEFPVTVSPSIVGIHADNLKECKFKNLSEKTCTSTVTLPQGTPKGEYYIAVKLQDNTSGAPRVQEGGSSHIIK